METRTAMEERTVTTPNMTCGRCVGTIERELKAMKGVSSVKADLPTQRVTVRWSAPATWEQIYEQLVVMGYPPEE